MELRGTGVAVFLGGRSGHGSQLMHAAQQLGELLAMAGATVVYGGASVGCMGALADGALRAGGKVVGVIPQRLVEREVAHPALTEQHVVTTMHARKALMFSRSKAFVALPGGYGTLDELCEVVTWRQLGMHSWPVVLVDVGGYWQPLLQQLDRAVDDGLMTAPLRDLVHVVSTPQAAVAWLQDIAEPPPRAASWG